MNIKRCDRCGEEIKTNTNWLDAITDAVQTVITAMTKKPVYEITNKTTGMQVDFCPACQKSFEQWMTYGQKIKKIKETVTPDAIIRDGKMYELKKEEQPDEAKQNAEDIKFGDF